MFTIYDYEYFKREVFTLTQIDLNAYQEVQMKRRIDTLIAKHKVTGYDQFVMKLQDDKAIFDDFVSYLTINLSEFYRNPDQWNLMDKEIIPYLIDKFGQSLKVWSAACSTGDEPYSLVMALSRHIPLNQINIIATDIDRHVLEKARTGLYNEKSIAAVPDDFKKKYFTKVGPSYRISNEIKLRVQFKQHNLLNDAYPERCHLIVCRNVLIYFTEEAKDEVALKFNAVLKPGGILFTGNTEQLINYKALNYERKNYFLYVKNK